MNVRDVCPPRQAGGHEGGRARVGARVHLVPVGQPRGAGAAAARAPHARAAAQGGARARGDAQVYRCFVALVSIIYIFLYLV